MQILTLLLVILSLFVLKPFVTAEEIIRIGGPNTISVLPKIAVEQGYFSEQELNVEFNQIQAGKLAMDAVVGEQIEFGVIVDSNLAFDSFRNSELRAVASIIEYYGTGFAFNRTKLASIEQLRGKRIGYLPATTSHLFLLRLLESQQLTMKDIVPVILQPPGMLPAIRAGVVDAVSIWVPWRTEILRAVPDVTEEGSDPLIYPSRSYLATTRKLIAQRPEVVEKVLRALHKAEHYVATHPQEAAVRYAQWNAMEQQVVDELWKMYRPKITFGDEATDVVREDIRLIRKFDPQFATKANRDVKELFDFATVQKLERQ